MLGAGIAEWRKSTSLKHDRQHEGTRDRLATAMGAAVAGAIDRISDKLNILATVGAVAPFVGLFGTVWGIMRSFTAIAGEQNTSLAVVAPGIAEALFATAIGLFAAIPAVIAHNRLQSWREPARRAAASLLRWPLHDVQPRARSLMAMDLSLRPSRAFRARPGRAAP